MVMSLAAPLPTVMAAAAPAPLALGSISGTVTSATGQILGHASVRLRNLADGQIGGATTSNTTGEFSFIGLPAGHYTVELVNAGGAIVGTSAMTSLPDGTNISGVRVSAFAGAFGTAMANTGAFLVSTGGIITAVAVGAGVAGVVVATNDPTASASE
jgi:hypothetical protein